MAEDKARHDVHSVPIDWQEVAVSPTIFANHLLVQADQYEFYLSFCDVAPPLIEGETDEEKLSAIRSLKSVKAKPVARIGISAERLEGVIAILRESLDKFKKVQVAGGASQRPDETESVRKQDQDVQSKAAG